MSHTLLVVEGGMSYTLLVVVGACLIHSL